LPPNGTRVHVQLPVPCHWLRIGASVVRKTTWRNEESAAVEFEPLTRAQQVSLNSALLELDQPHGANATILLMIDDPDAQLAIGKTLHGRGYSLVSRTTPLDVIQHYVQSAGPPLRAAIVSTALPFGAGQDVLDFLAAEHPAVKRVVLIDTQSCNDGTRASRPDLVIVSPFHDNLADALTNLDGQAAG